MRGQQEVTVSKDHAIYTRLHPAHVWQFEYRAWLEIALLEREVNRRFRVDTLIVPLRMIDGEMLMRFLRASHTQADFPGVPQMAYRKYRRLRQAQLADVPPER